MADENASIVVRNYANLLHTGDTETDNPIDNTICKNILINVVFGCGSAQWYRQCQWQRMRNIGIKHNNVIFGCGSAQWYRQCQWQRMRNIAIKHNNVIFGCGSAQWYRQCQWQRMRNIAIKHNVTFNYCNCFGNKIKLILKYLLNSLL